MKTKSISKAAAFAAKMKPLLSAVDYTASEAFDGLNSNSPEFVMVDPVTAAYKAAGKDWNERKLAFADRAEKAGAILSAAGVKAQRDGLTYYVRL